MSASLGRVTARLAEPAERVTAGLIELINSNVNPPTPVGAEDVYIRAMFVVSDEVNSFGGRFPVEEHDRLVELLIDSPVMVGHRKDKLPIARNFHAATVERDGRRWVKSYFYWLKSAEGADNLRENIDGGIYKECSIGFTFLFPECSICGKDIRSCEHEPLATYEVDGQSVVCHFNYRQIERVLETSLVYRGAVNDTSVSKDLKIDKSRTIAEAASLGEPVELNDPLQLDNGDEYLVTPYYDGPLVLIAGSGEDRMLYQPDGTPLSAAADRFDLRRLPSENEIYAFLVPYRGKERLERQHLAKFLEGRRGPASRLELKLLPAEGLELAGTAEEEGPDCIRLLRYEVVAAGEVDSAARRLMTRDGVRLWPVTELPPRSAGYRYRPKAGRTAAESYTIFGVGNGQMLGDHAVLAFPVEGRTRWFIIRQFHLARLKRGARFVADEATEGATAQGSPQNSRSGRVVELTQRNGGFVLRLAGPLDGDYAMRSIRLDGRERFLFYRKAGQS